MHYPNTQSDNNWVSDYDGEWNYVYFVALNVQNA